MRKKKIEPKEKRTKDISNDELAIMVNRGFQNVEERFQEVHKKISSLREEIHDEVGNIRGKLDDVREETRLGFKRVDGSLMRIERRLEYQDEEVFKVRDRLKILETKLHAK